MDEGQVVDGGHGAGGYRLAGRVRSNAWPPIPPLHISKDEQRARLQSRLDDPAKHWKFGAGDLEERKRWPDHQRAFRDTLTATSTAAAPWYVVPADRKWYHDWAILTILARTLENMDPQHPPAPEGLTDVAIV